MKIDRRETLQERYEKLPEGIKEHSPIKTLVCKEINDMTAQEHLYLTERCLWEITNQLNFITNRLYGEKIIDTDKYVPSHRGIEYTSKILSNQALHIAQKLFELEKLI